MKTLRKKWLRRPRVVMPDLWRVFGVAVTWERMDFTEKTEAAANHAAERINARGGRVEVERLVYDSPAAAWRSLKDVRRGDA